LSNGNATSSSLNVGRVFVLPVTTNNYSIIGLSGGNATGYIYGDYQLLGDGIHIGYNAYGSNGAWVNPASYYNTRISFGYGYIGMYYGTVTGNATAGPSNVALFMDGTNGRIGIGCNSPQTALDVNGSGRYVTNGTVSTSAWGGYYGTDTLAVITNAPVGVNSNGVASILFANSTQANFPYGRIATIDQQVGNGAFASTMVFQTNGGGVSLAERMRINSNGYVGIGCNAPTYMLDVAGTINTSAALHVSATAGASTTGLLKLASASSANYIQSGLSTTNGSVAPLFFTSMNAVNTWMTIASNGSVGIATTTPATALDVNGGVTIRNGYRPTYSNVSSGTSLTINANTYGTHFNITTSALTGITLPTVTGSTDSNAYWVFRNNTAGYLSITFTYTTAGTTYPANPVTIPPANSLTMMVTYPSSVLGYVLF